MQNVAKYLLPLRKQLHRETDATTSSVQISLPCRELEKLRALPEKNIRKKYCRFFSFFGFSKIVFTHVVYSLPLLLFT